MAGTVLIVEDEQSIGSLVRAYLERDAFQVVWVRNGEAALAELDRHPVRIVVLDVGLPGIDGFEVCRRMRMSSRRGSSTSSPTWREIRGRCCRASCCSTVCGAWTTRARPARSTSTSLRFERSSADRT